MPLKANFSTHSQSPGQLKKLCQDTFLHPLSHFPSNTCKCNSSSSCSSSNSSSSIAILGSTSIVTHSVNQCLLKNQPGSGSCKSARKWQLQPFATSCMKDYEGQSLMQTSLAELPNRQHYLCGWWQHPADSGTPS